MSEGADEKPTFADSQCYLAAMAGDPVAVIRWARRGARIDRLSRMGLLVEVADRGLLDVVRVLLDEGADPNFGMARGAATPLWACAKSGHVSVFELLRERGAVLPEDPGRQRRLLFRAALSGHAPMVRLLVGAGIDVDCGKDSGFTPLMMAAGAGRTQAARTLLELGADATLQNSAGKTARWIAEARGYREIVALLPTEPGYQSPSLGDQLRGRTYRMLSSLLKRSLAFQRSVVDQAAKRRTRW
jgi:hypothetical protein